jgi:AraC-like DNA-binding protein
MYLDGLHEKDIFDDKFPFRIIYNTCPEFEYPFHWHKAVEILYVINGSVNVQTYTNEYSLSETDILLIGDGIVHNLQTGKQVNVVIFQFDASMLDSIGFINSINPIISNTYKISSSDDTNFHCSMELQILQIIEEYSKKTFAFPLVINARVYDILTLISRKIYSELDGKLFSNKSAKTSTSLEKLRNALKFIDDNYQFNITLTDVAASSGFSQFHFSRTFKEVSGKNFLDYLNTYRIKKAERLLINNENTITEVAHMVGFNSLSTFNRLFRTIKKCSPSDYRKLFVK